MTKYGKRTLEILGSITLLFGLTSGAQAGTITLITSPFTNTDSVSFTSGACIGDQVSANYTCANGTTLTSSLSNVLTFSNDDVGFAPSDNNDEVVPDGSSPGQFNGNFGLGSEVLTTVETGDLLTISFSTDVSEVGLEIQEIDYNGNTFTASMNVNGNTACTGVSGGCTETGGGTAGSDPIFIGLDSTSSNISSITITTSDTNSNGSGNFGIEDLIFDEAVGSTPPPPPPTVPEPSTVAMMIGGIGVLGWKARNRVKA